MPFLLVAAALGYLFGGLSGVAVGVLAVVGLWLLFVVFAVGGEGGGAARTPTARERRTEEQREMEVGHLHKCGAGHLWQHVGPTSLRCALAMYGDLIPQQDCAVCAGRDDLLIRGPHSHSCFSCRGEWQHKGRCVTNPFQCPWCSPGASPDSPSTEGAHRGSHRHFCPQCLQEWDHAATPAPENREVLAPLVRTVLRRKPTPRPEPCAAPHRAVLADCLGCRDVARRQARPHDRLTARAFGRAVGRWLR